MGADIVTHTSLMAALSEPLQQFREWRITSISYAMANPDEMLLGIFLLLALAVNGVVLHRIVRTWF